MIEEKTWSKDMETPILDSWRTSEKYKFNKGSNKPVFSIDTPPPYINSPIHIGQTTTYVLMDMFARFRRMIGYEVIFPMGLDRNGIPIEMAAEKKFNIKLTQTPREEFISKCKQMLEESGTATTETFFHAGISFSSWNFGKDIGDAYMTDSDDYRAQTQASFIDMWKRGLIYEAERINNYCAGCRTTLADSEIEYKDKPSNFNDIVFTVKETGEKIVIGTTRPELIPSCGMVIFNPDDKRYSHLEGKTAITPIFNLEVRIKSHPQAQIGKGTGLVMMCSAGDVSDIRFFREQNLKPIISIDIEGKMNGNAGFLEGLFVKDARKKIVDELSSKNLLAGSKSITHRTPTCERSGHDVEFIAMKELYLKQVDFVNNLKTIADRINFYSPQSKQILLDWLNSISTDWPLSRRRYYATEIPLWRCHDCNETYVPAPGKYYKPWKEQPEAECSCGSKNFIGEERVLDTWFDSSFSPFYILGYGRDQDFFFSSYPCSLRPQGKEITRTWLYYTLLRGYHMTSKPAFKDVWINHHITDEKGYKMSKSKGNGIDPMEALTKFGAEPFRLWAALEGNITDGDFKCSFQRIEGNVKTLVKLWNVCKFIDQFPMIDAKPKKREIDNWILKEINEIVKFTRERYEKYDFHNPAVKIRNFLWETFASHYLEIVKPRAYNQDGKFKLEEQAGAVQTLKECLEILLKLLAPITPIITERLYGGMWNKDIHIEPFPEYHSIKSSISAEELMSFNGNVWKLKKDSNISLKDPIGDVVMPSSLKSIEDDLRYAHKIEKITYG